MVRDEQNLMFGLDEFKFDGKSWGFIEGRLFRLGRPKAK